LPCNAGDILSESEITELDARGLDCPMPLLKAKRALNGLRGGERLRVLATDKGSVRDFEVFAHQSGHPLISSEERDGVFIHVIEKLQAEG
jgi:TusA-related sulfurtransferase